MAFSALLGDKLLGQDGADVPVSSLDGKHVLLYFSAHWCPPCRAFTPKLSGWYSGLKEDMDRTDFEMVFVSSDKDEGQFKEYFGEMPFLALPYADRDRKAALGKQFKVQGIPTLVVLKPDGTLLTAKGRAKVEETMKNPDFKFEDWGPKTLPQIIAGGNVTDKSGQQTPGAAVMEKDVVGLYFSAHWCPPCRRFTPGFAKTYQKLQEAGKSFEVVFVSGDRDEKQFAEYLGEMPWKSLPFKDARIAALNDLFDVEGIPHLVLYDTKANKVITQEGVGEVSDDEDGAKFPWAPQPVNPCNGSVGGYINEVPVFVAFSKPAEAEAASKAMWDVAAAALADDNDDMRFVVATDHPIVEKVRSVCQIPADLPYAILDLGSGGKVYDGPMDAKLSAETVTSFVQAFKAGALQARQLG